MTPWTIFPLALMTGVLFNFNPSRGSAIWLWTSTQKARWKMALPAAIRFGVLALGN